MAFSYQPLICPNCGTGTGLKRETGEWGDSMVCRYCGVRTLIEPPEDDEKYLYFAHYENGVSELRALRFDRAAEEFREAYDLDPDRPDALWGLICAEYGIVQVKSYHDQKYNPIFCLVNYKERTPFAVNEQVRQLRSCIARMCEDYEIYRDWLADVERQIQKIMEATPKPHTWKWDVFIACKISKATERFPNADGKTPEHEEALRLHKELTERGLRVFYSEKYFVDNMGKPDSDWQIMTALLNSRQMLLVCGGAQNDEKLNTPWVRSEWMRWRSMQKQGVKKNDSLLVYSISESTRSLPEGLYTGNTVYPAHRAELLKTLERNCYTDEKCEDDILDGQKKLGKADFSGAAKVFGHVADMRPRMTEPHVYLFFCDFGITGAWELEEAHLARHPESNVHFQDAEARDICKLLQNVKSRLQDLRDQKKDNELAKMRKQMEEMQRKMQESALQSASMPSPPIETIRYSQGLSFGKLDDGTYAVAGIGTCKDTELVIPPMTPEGGKVTQISKSAFEKQTQLASVVIPNSVTSIGDSAFDGCSGLTSVTIPNSVTFIGEDAFCECSGLTSATIPNSVESIGNEAFLGCSGLTSVTIPNSVKSIGERAFAVCSGLTSVTIPNSMTFIGDRAFYGCSGLTSVTIPNSVESIGNEAFAECSSLTSVTIPNSVTSIEDWAFSECSGLTSVTIPNSVTSIGDYAFYKCSGLTSVTIPNSVTSIGDRAFSYCSGLTSVTISNRVNSIGACAFRSCSGLTSVTIPNSVNSIGAGAFWDCSGLTSVTISNSVNSIGECAFRDCSSLTSVTIPNSVTSIGQEAFFDCSGLTSVIIPKSVDKVGSWAFAYCSKVTFYCEHRSKPANWEKNWKPHNRPVVWNYKPTTHTTTESSAITPVSASRQEVLRYSQGLEFEKLDDGTYAVKGMGTCKDTELVIPSTTPEGGEVTSIGEAAFWKCSGLTSVTIPNGVNTIGPDAFYGCSGLAFVTIPNSANSIGAGTFSGCSGLAFVTIPNSITSIGEGAFYKCTGLTSIKVESNNSKYYSQDNCVIERETKCVVVGIQTSRIPGNVTSIGAYAFSSCSGLTSVTIPNSVTSIGSKAFWGCKGLTSVTIPDSVTEIGNCAFGACPNVTIYCTPLQAFQLEH